MNDPPIGVCFVCLGNICRSPTAEGVMQHLVAQASLEDRFLIDSAGTGAYHVGERADPRSRAEARRRGLELASRARQFVAGDYRRFDYVIAMDRQNQRHLEGLAGGPAELAKLFLLRTFEDSPRELDVPDPYYGGDRGFADVFDIVERACRGLLAHIRAEHGC
jgi:protein-tyrosine phosphatase